jgi:hypothetical protein
MGSDIFLFLLIGLFFSYLGYIFKFKKKVNLISGIDVSKVKDIDGLADWVGSNMFLLSALTVVLAVLQFLYPNLSSSLFMVFGGVVLVDVILTVALGQKYVRGVEAERLQSSDARQLEEAKTSFESPVAQLDAKERTPLERVLNEEESKKVRL